MKRTTVNKNECERRVQRIRKEKENYKEELILHLKKKFRHIKGMNPKTARFESEQELMESWRTTLLIEQVVFNPQKKLIECEAGVGKLFAEQALFDRYLSAYRQNKRGT